jgi:hypothetical protein
MVFYPVQEVVLTYKSNVVYLDSVEEWLPCVPEVVRSLRRRSVERIPTRYGQEAAAVYNPAYRTAFLIHVRRCRIGFSAGISAGVLQDGAVGQGVVVTDL